jgi:ribosomal protein S2
MTTVQKSIKRLKELEQMAAEGAYGGRAKKEIVRLERERKHLDSRTSPASKTCPACRTCSS